MDHSYVYTKRFIDSQVKKLGTPLRIDLELRLVIQGRVEDLDEIYNHVDEKVLQSVLDKVNIRIKRYTSNMFKSQVTNQIVQQVMKLEQSKVEEVRDRLVTITRVMKPLMVPDGQGYRGNYLKEFSDLVEELPESKYLLLGKEEAGDGDEETKRSQSDDETKGSESDHETDESDKDSNLVQDFEVRIEKSITTREKRRQFRESVDKFIEETQGTKELLFKYNDIRQSLVELKGTLKYKQDKLEYLQTLEAELVEVLGVSVAKPKNNLVYDSDEETNATGGIQSNLMSTQSNGELINEINRFRILVEKIGFKLGNKDLQEIAKRVNN